MDYVNIPDSNLKAVINKQLDPPQPPEHEITEEQMLSLTNLYAGVSNIVDLTGLQWAKNLTELQLSFNLISDISPLTSLTKLTVLTLHYNKIADINPLKQLVDLVYLDLENNEILDISALDSLINLEDLILDSNNIKDISSLSSLVKLNSLYLQDNEISDISPLNTLETLQWLVLSNNYISDISPLSLLKNLLWLNLSSNNVITLDGVSSLENLLVLYIPNNKISDISSITSVVSLEWLQLNRNEISDITPLSYLKNLWMLNLSGNQISDLTGINSLANLVDFNASDQSIITKGSWNNGTLVISTTIIKNKDGSTPSKIENISPSNGVYNSITKIVNWDSISYNTEVSFNFIGKDTFSGKVIRLGNTGPKALQLQLSREKTTTINYGEPIIFNNTIYRSYGIEYDNTSGVITFTHAGLYNINWWVAGFVFVNNPVFAIEIEGKDIIIGNSNNYPGQVTGNGIIEVIQVPMSIKLISLTTSCQKRIRVLLSSIVPVQGSITIVDGFNYY